MFFFEDKRAGTLILVPVKRDGAVVGVACADTLDSTTGAELSGLLRIAEWNRHFEQSSDLIMPVKSADDIRLAKQLGKVGIMFGAQNCSPIEDDIGMVEVMRELNLMIMQLTYNNQIPKLDKKRDPFLVLLVTPREMAPRWFKGSD